MGDAGPCELLIISSDCRDVGEIVADEGRAWGKWFCSVSSLVSR